MEHDQSERDDDVVLDVQVEAGSAPHPVRLRVRPSQSLLLRVNNSGHIEDVSLEFLPDEP